jgi:hypothetical protein
MNIISVLDDFGLPGLLLFDSDSGTIPQQLRLSVYFQQSPFESAENALQRSSTGNFERVKHARFESLCTIPVKNVFL